MDGVIFARLPCNATTRHTLATIWRILLGPTVQMDKLTNEPILEIKVPKRGAKISSVYVSS